jgi:hypothetical protein
MEKEIRRPETDDHFPFTQYIKKAPGSDFMKILESQYRDTPDFLQAMNKQQWDYRYAPGKWSIKELVMHIIDFERIFDYRALRIARNDKTPLSGYEQDDYIPYLDTENRTPASIIEEYKDIRKATISMFKNFNADMLLRTGTASGNALTPLMIGFIIAGHETHHMQILTERYLKSTHA